MKITLSNIRTSKSEEAGQTLVEFALVLTFIILPITFVFIDGALTLFTLVNVTNAAREAAHAGSIFVCSADSTQPNYCNMTYNQSLVQQASVIDTARQSSIQTYLQSDPFGRLRNLVAVNQCTVAVQYTTLNPVNPPDQSCTAGSNPPCPNPGNPYRELDSMTLNVACPHPFLFGLVGTGVITLNATSTMRIEPGGMAPQQ